MTAAPRKTTLPRGIKWGCRDDGESILLGKFRGESPDEWEKIGVMGTVIEAPNDEKVAIQVSNAN